MQIKALTGFDILSILKYNGIQDFNWFMKGKSGVFVQTNMSWFHSIVNKKEHFSIFESDLKKNFFVEIYC